MRHVFLSLLTIVAVAVTTVAQGPTRTKVMLLDGESGGPYHKWQLGTPLIRQVLEETGRFDVTVVTAPAATGVLDGFMPDFAAYKAVIFNYDAPDERWPAPIKAAFERYVDGGGGVVIVHAADNAFSGWKAFNDMIGVGGWRDRTVASGPYWYYKDDKLLFTRTTSSACSERRPPGCIPDVGAGGSADGRSHLPGELVVVDDVADSGRTLGLVIKLLRGFGAEVRSLRYDDDAKTWQVTVLRGDGPDAAETTETFDAVVAATGQLNRPHIPDIEGLDSFDGPVFHSARWDHDVDLTGRHVGVVGIGASAIQFVPAIAESAASLTLFQRSANYVAPKADAPLSPRARRLLRVEALRKAYRFSIWARFEARFMALRDGSTLNRMGQNLFDKGLAKAVGPKLTPEMVVPDYALGCKRILIANDWYPTLMRPDVTVVPGGVQKVEPGAVVVDGVSHPVDTLIFGTGFESTGFLMPMTVTGRHGVDLQESWAEGAEAHLGITVSGFPNLFVLYGPNTNLGHNSIVFMLERQISYALTCIRSLVSDPRPLDVRPGAQAASNRRLERRLATTVWATACHSWYKTESGRITNNWSGTTSDYWRRTWRPRWTDFDRV